MTKVFKCPDCKGKGHIFEAASLLNPVRLLLYGFGDMHDKDGETRKECAKCEGEGFILIKKDK